MNTNTRFNIDETFAPALKSMGLDSIDAVFAFSGGCNLAKATLANHRSRIRFETENPAATLFLKRYEHTPAHIQIKNWLGHRRIASTMFYDLDPAQKLAAAGINTPQTVCCGSQWGMLFEKRSFIITRQIPGESLERLLPPCFNNLATDFTDYTESKIKNQKSKIAFIKSLAEFAHTFHATGYRHRDFYLAHIFHHDGIFYLIDLQRAFRPLLFAKRYRIKDIAQLSYSAQKKHFSHTDRLRFYLAYTSKFATDFADYTESKIGNPKSKIKRRLEQNDKSFIRAVIKKMSQMADHDRKHGRAVPFQK